MIEPTVSPDPHTLLRDEVADLITGYLQRYPGATDAYTSDPVYHHTMRHLEAVLWLVAMGMQDVGIPEAMRIQVLRAALYGSAPLAAEAHDRIRAAAAEAARLARGEDIGLRLDAIGDVLGPERPL